MEVASHKADSLRIRVPAMEEEEGSVDADGRRPRSDCFGPERRLDVDGPSSKAAPGVDRRPNPAFLVGFKDCHQEVLRYLVNIERVPLEGPVIFGLEKHLASLESRMQTTSCDCAADHNNMSCETLIQSNCATQIHVNKTDEDEDEFSSFRNCLTTAQDGRFLDEEEEDDEEEKEPVCDTSSSSRERDRIVSEAADDDVNDAAAVRAENSSFDSGCCDSSGLLLVVASSSSSSEEDDSSLSMDCSTYDEVSTTAAPSSAAAAVDRPKQGNGGAKDASAETTITESELAENALELMHLAHNNPCISRILNELFVLMENDYDDDDVDDDDDDDDGIEMEENDGINSELHDDC